MKRTLSMVLVLAMLISAMLGVVSFADTEAAGPVLKVSKATVEFGSSVYVYIAVDYSAFGSSEGITLNIKNNKTNNSVNLTPDTSLEALEGCVAFKYDTIGAKHMGDELTIQAMKDGKASGDAKTFSVLEYALKAEDLNEQKLTALMDAMLAYGAAAQDAYNYEGTYDLSVEDYSLVTLPDGATFANGAKKAILKDKDQLTATKSDANDTDYWLNSAIQQIGQGKSITISYKKDNQHLFIAPAGVFGTNQYYFDMDCYTGADIKVNDQTAASEKKPTVNGYGTNMIINAGTYVDITTGYMKMYGNCSVQYLGSSQLQKAVKEATDKPAGSRVFTMSITAACDASSTGTSMLGNWSIRTSRGSSEYMYRKSGNNYVYAGSNANGSSTNFTVYKNQFFVPDGNGGYKKLEYPVYGRLALVYGSGHSLTGHYNADGTGQAKTATTVLNATALDANAPGKFSTVHIVFDLDKGTMSYYMEGSKTAVLVHALPVQAEFLVKATLEHSGSANATTYLKSVVVTQGNITDYFN